MGVIYVKPYEDMFEFLKHRKNEHEEKMLLNLHKRKSTDRLTLQRFDTHSKTNEQTVPEMLNLAVKYNKAVQEEDELPPKKLAIANVGRQYAKKHLENMFLINLMSSNIVQTLGDKMPYEHDIFNDIKSRFCQQKYHNALGEMKECNSNVTTSD